MKLYLRLVRICSARDVLMTLQLTETGSAHSVELGLQRQTFIKLNGIDLCVIG